MHVCVGTSGWHYKHWRGDFYPAGLPPGEWLRWYAHRFDTVELNASFYRQPAPSAWDLWRRQSARGFVFAVKGSRYITHIKRLAVERSSVDLVMEGARRLGPHLGPLLWQLPPTFRRETASLERLERFLALLPRDARHVFEFRDRSWFVEDTFALLEAAGASFCTFHMPGLEAPLQATGGILYLRFHGSGTKYGGGYALPELEQWARRVAACRADQAYVYFNNDLGGHAPRDAAAFREAIATVSATAAGS